MNKNKTHRVQTTASIQRRPKSSIADSHTLLVQFFMCNTYVTMTGVR